jgi:2-polyprenyl-3-methyl-5-hydroxy-6-metoxy-1,4-benzoquinol methylase
MDGGMSELLAQEDYERGGLQKHEYSASEVVEVPCPLCGEREGTTLSREHGSIGVKRCANCSLIYTSPRIRDPEKVYWGDYAKYVAEARLIFSGRATHHRDPNYLEELELIEGHRPSLGRFLDVGCNMGMLLRLARARGWDAVGVEPSPTLHRIATVDLGLNVYNCFLDDVPSAEDGAFDVVALSDVFEHVTEPRAMLSAVARLLKPDGLLYVKVPNARWNILKQRLAKRIGDASSRNIWDSYEHVVHYTEETLRAMLEAGGFEPLVLTFSRPVQIPVWHEYVGQYFQYPSPWILDPKRHFGRAAAHAVARVEARLRPGRIGYCAQNLVAVASRRV